MSRSICLYTASSNSLDPVYFELAKSFGTLLGRRGDTLIYGGGMVGLMGATASAVQESGGKVVAIIPEKLNRPGITFEGADELIVTRDMSDRKAMMESRADAFVVLPGGFGTFDELFQTLANKQLTYHNKPIVLLDTNGFFKPFSELADHLVRTRFARPVYQQMYVIVHSPEEAFAYIDGYIPIDYNPFLKERA